MRTLAALVALLSLSAACAPAPASPANVAPVATTAAPVASAKSPPIDDKALAAALGVDKVETSADGAVKATWPRTDVEVSVDGWKMAPFMGLSSWVAFTPGKKGIAEAMIMGDLVLFEDEVNAVMSKLLDGGVSVTALHNHFLYAQPSVFFMHVGGEGKTADLARAVKSALDQGATMRKASPKPATASGRARLPEKSSIDATKVDAPLATKGQATDGAHKAVWGRDVTASCGCSVGKAMGITTWSAFGGTDDDAIVDGDFAVSEAELQPVLKSLRAGGIDVVAIHHHMSGETPRVLFIHYWGRGTAAALAGTVKKTLDLTAWSGKP